MPDPTVTLLGTGSGSVALPHEIPIGNYVVAFFANNNNEPTIWFNNNGFFPTSTLASNFDDLPSPEPPFVRIDAGLYEVVGGPLPSGSLISGLGAITVYEVSNAPSGLAFGSYSAFTGQPLESSLPFSVPSSELPILIFGAVAGSDDDFVLDPLPSDPVAGISSPPNGIQTVQGEVGGFIFWGLATAYEYVDNSTGPFQTVGSFTANHQDRACAGICYLVGFPPLARGEISIDLDANGRPFRGYTENGGAFVDSYDCESFPYSVSDTFEIVPDDSGVTGISLRRRVSKDSLKSNSIWDALIAKDGKLNVYTSRDNCRTWSLTMAEIADGQDVVDIVDQLRGLKLAFCWNEDEEAIYLTIGEEMGDGTFGNWSTPVLIVSDAKRGFDAKRLGSGIYMLSYRDTDDVLQDVYSRKVSRDGTSTWA